MPYKIATAETSEEMYRIVQNIAKEEAEAEEEERRRVSKLQHTSVGVFPTKAELPEPNEQFLPSPLCPRCGNQDPRAFLDDELVVTLGGRPGQYPISIIERAKYACSQQVECLSCSCIFDFAPVQNPFDNSPPQNMGRSSRAYVARLVA